MLKQFYKSIGLGPAVVGLGPAGIGLGPAGVGFGPAGVGIMKDHFSYHYGLG